MSGTSCTEPPEGPLTPAFRASSPRLPAPPPARHHHSLVATRPSLEEKVSKPRFSALIGRARRVPGATANERRGPRGADRAGIAVKPCWLAPCGDHRRLGGVSGAKLRAEGPQARSIQRSSPPRPGPSFQPNICELHLSPWPTLFPFCWPLPFLKPCAFPAPSSHSPRVPNCCRMGTGLCPTSSTAPLGSRLPTFQISLDITLDQINFIR